MDVQCSRLLSPCVQLAERSNVTSFLLPLVAQLYTFCCSYSAYYWKQQFQVQFWFWVYGSLLSAYWKLQLQLRSESGSAWCFRSLAIWVWFTLSRSLLLCVLETNNFRFRFGLGFGSGYGSLLFLWPTIPYLQLRGRQCICSGLTIWVGFAFIIFCPPIDAY